MQPHPAYMQPQPHMQPQPAYMQPQQPQMQPRTAWLGAQRALRRQDNRIKGKLDPVRACLSSLGMAQSERFVVCVSLPDFQNLIQTATEAELDLYLFDM